MKSTENFKKVIEDQIKSIAVNHTQLAEGMKNEKKNINDCITYILNEVQKSGCNGFTDEEIYNIAVRYYIEENINIGNPVNARVVVNHKVEETKTTTTPIKTQPTVKTHEPKKETTKGTQLTMF